MTDIYEWESYIQGPRWVNLHKLMWEYTKAYGCTLEKWGAEKAFLSQIAFFTISGPQQNLQVLQQEIINNLNIQKREP